jgi:hypothetical protein
LTEQEDVENTGLMYGKHFASMYTGSMYGKPPAVFAVWGYVISHFRPSRKDGQCYVELNPLMLAGIFGTTPAEILSALDVLESPDPASRSREEDGRRLILLNEERTLGPLHYRIVNGPKYRAIRDEDDRREYLKEAQRLSRLRRKDGLSTKSTAVNHGIPSYTEAESEAESDPEEENSPSRPSGSKKAAARGKTEYPEGFAAAWAAYPHFGQRRSKVAAHKVWASRGLEKQAESVLAWIAFAAKSHDWTKTGPEGVGQFVPAMEVWLKRIDFFEPPPAVVLGASGLDDELEAAWARANS